MTTDRDTDRSTGRHDVIVVGARCAGSPLAMLLARRGHRVLVVDRASFPSDTLSTHMIHPPGVAALRRWGLLPAVVATNCPPIRTYGFDFGPFTIRGTPRTDDGVSTAYAPRRTVLDKILVDAAADAGAEVRERFTVEDLLVEDGTVTGVRGRGADGRRVAERARVVVGADGRNSRVARLTRARRYRDAPRLQWSYYSYWSGLPVDGFETVLRPGRGFAALPTNDGLTLLTVGWPVTESAEFRSDIEANYLATLDLVPEFAERVRAARREERFLGGAVPGFFHTPYGPGWALVGDAGYNRDPVTAQGISDAFLDAELCAAALDGALTGARPFAEVMAEYQRARDARVLSIYDLTLLVAPLAPLPDELRDTLAATSRDRAAMDGFAGVFAGTTSPEEFFAPGNVARITAGA